MIGSGANPTVRAALPAIARHFARFHDLADREGRDEAAPLPELDDVQAIVELGFWASLRREEGRSPRISIAFLPPERAGVPLLLERPIRVTPEALSHLAPAVERPGIHLGVWRGADGYWIWGATRDIPDLCMVLEVVQPGLLVVKHRRGAEIGKFANVAVIEGDQARLVDDAWVEADDAGPIACLLGAAQTDAPQVLVQLAISMRAHGHGGTLLVVPHDTERWRGSIVTPMRYPVAPSFSRMTDLLGLLEGTHTEISWKDHFRRVVDGVAGLTAVDGATILTHRFGVLAFGAKIGRLEGSAPVERLLLTEPVVGASPVWMHPTELGGTRHLSAAQFAHDQRDAVAMVASQDGQFTVFAWSEEHGAVQAHRIEVLLF